MTNGGINRRDFLKGAAATAVMAFTAKDLLAAEGATEEKPLTGPPVKIGVIGLGLWGRDILSTLSKMPSVKATAVCDIYEPYIKRATRIAPDAATFTDYRKMLESSEVEAVIVATPSHQHKQITLDALQAGKHVYCESPIAHTIEDAKAIALAGKNSGKVFQAGLQGRANPLYEHIHKFVLTGALGNLAQIYGQWNKKNSWKRMAPTPEREKDLNWRIYKETSPGLLGEVGIHQVDLANWYVRELPVAVTGFGSIMAWKDGRTVPDTVQAIIEYPGGVRMLFTSTLASSFSNCYTLFQGSESSLVMRDEKGWMVKEADSALLGWEVYAHKEECFGETGICMIADATKIIKEGKEPGEESADDPTREPLYVALDSFARCIRDGSESVCGPKEGYQAAVAALKANEAVMSGTRLQFKPEEFEL